MTFRRIQLSAVAMVLCILFLAPGVAQPTDRGIVQNGSTSTTSIGWPPPLFFWAGCWKASSEAMCVDVVYEVRFGNYFTCGPCGTTNPTAPTPCGNQISEATLLNTGEWCDIEYP